MKHFHLSRHFLRPPFQPVLVSSPNESLEQRMRLQRLRFELRMELASDEMRMVRKLNHLHISSVRRRPRNPQPARRQCFLILTIEFITMPVPFADLKLSIDFMRQSSRLNFASPGPQPHSPAKFLDPAQLAQFVNHPMRRRRIELTGISVGQPAHVASKLDASRLHPQTNSEVRNLLLPRIANRNQHALRCRAYQIRPAPVSRHIPRADLH